MPTRRAAPSKPWSNAASICAPDLAPTSAPASSTNSTSASSRKSTAAICAQLYEDIELPLTGVLARMEHTGIRIDTDELARLSALMETEIARLTAEIHALAGRQFNISSPQQLGQGSVRGPGPARARALRQRQRPSPPPPTCWKLWRRDHEIVRKVLEYRQLTKLKGTYVDALPALIDPATGRLHTSFNQTGAATGRLSSSNPNLQNIPISTELGREIRAAFVPRDGWKLIVADYSQIELRLLAHMSDDPVLIDAFRNGEDIHTRTAAEVMGVPPMLVTREARNNAKAVNFGIVYGISAFGLAANLGISRKEAEQYIKAYFERYAGSETVHRRDHRRRPAKPASRARSSGASAPFPISTAAIPTPAASPNARPSTRPIQGTAADLIKLAMVRIDRALAGFQTKMLLQVHDELVLESPPEEAEQLSRLVKKEMEGVCA